ncbi:MAG TPA: GFA family protein [Allosphingosinicella sp.]|jgi:hypothetical protein|nr:GFA family protein [Allosphingosinicella sp.]
MAVEGGCLCRQVRFSIEAAPMAARMCWCRLCQYLGAGSATVNVCFPSEAMTLTGEVRWHESVADSGSRMRRGFCPTCGTPLFSVAEPRPHLIFVRAGALDEPNLMAPAAIIWTGEAPDWACLDPDVPQYPAQIPPVA